MSISNLSFISNNHKGLTISDLTSAVFACKLPWKNLDVSVFSSKIPWCRISEGCCSIES